MGGGAVNNMGGGVGNNMGSGSGNNMNNMAEFMKWTMQNMNNMNMMTANMGGTGDAGKILYLFCLNWPSIRTGQQRKILFLVVIVSQV